MSLLPLLQVSDSAFPTGSFSHSMGLEGLVTHGLVDDVTALEDSAIDYLRSLATSDIAVARAAAEPSTVDELAALDRALAATRLSAEQRTASAATGRSLLDSAAALGLDDARLTAYCEKVRARSTPGGYAVAYGVVTAAMRIPGHDALYGYAYTAGAAFVTAGQKLLTLGQRAIQHILFRLHPHMTEAVETSRHADPNEPFAFAPLLEVAAMIHERQTNRMYIS